MNEKKPSRRMAPDWVSRAKPMPRRPKKRLAPAEIFRAVDSFFMDFIGSLSFAAIRVFDNWW
jgi:hypothetical protein